MLLSKKWLKDYVDISVSDKEFADVMTMSGSKVEGFSREGAEMKNIVVGQVLSIERHPDSDHLWVCQVNVGGDEAIQIVTGAQNVNALDFVPVALHDSVVFGGKEIKKGKLRGVESCGMLCSLAELGLTAHDFPYALSDGIFVLGGDCELAPGMDIRGSIGLDDVVTEFEITSNRPDCLSVIGLAREAAASFKVSLKMPEPAVKPGDADVNELLSVNISDSENCYRYAGAVVRNVRIEPSPRWMRERLRASGVRPINNIVDITNYVMLEFGQPMHAFDLRFLEGNTVDVRRAENGETITTLDGIQRTLDDSMLVIADKKKPVAVAGVMGGEFSGIMEDTREIVFESACFKGTSVRATAKKLGMRTEASSRYEKELDPKGCVRSLNRALELVQLLNAGDVVNGIVDCDCSKDDVRELPFDWEWVNRFIGIDVSPEEQREMLERIGFTVDNGKILVPSFRGDVLAPADISEEIARFYGYENIENRPFVSTTVGRLTESQKLGRLISENLLAAGLSECVTYSFISPKYYDKINLPENDALRKSVVIMNPLGEDTSVMRTTPVPSMLEALSRNYNNRNSSAKCFELSTVYLPVEGQELPLEKVIVTMGMYGGCDFFTAKGVVENLLCALGLLDYDVEAVTDCPYLHPGRAAKISAEGESIGFLGEVHPSVLENYEIETKAYVACLDFEMLEKYDSLVKTYKSLPKYPASSRDLAFVCGREIPVLILKRAIAKAVGAMLESVTLFDVYEGEQIPTDKKSVAFSLMLRSADKTLTDEEADSAVKRAVKALDKLGVSLRS
ncbi:MAG: phenylalanine--tRNA ligase subunit beta [Oscillospiraceae bacterium]|nr:phenylalanine--tRNA ligase subunit beta [Oscillospiraceae bacterium]